MISSYAIFDSLKCFYKINNHVMSDVHGCFFHENNIFKNKSKRYDHVNALRSCSNEYVEYLKKRNKGNINNNEFVKRFVFKKSKELRYFMFENLGPDDKLYISECNFFSRNHTTFTEMRKAIMKNKKSRREFDNSITITPLGRATRCIKKYFKENKPKMAKCFFIYNFIIVNKNGINISAPFSFISFKQMAKRNEASLIGKHYSLLEEKKSNDFHYYWEALFKENGKKFRNYFIFGLNFFNEKASADNTMPSTKFILSPSMKQNIAVEFSKQAVEYDSSNSFESISSKSLIEYRSSEYSLPESTSPEYSSSESSSPEYRSPEYSSPEYSSPESTLPESTSSESSLFESTLPELTLSESILPESILPEFTLPESTLPESTLPESTLPEFTLPKSTLPESIWSKIFTHEATSLETNLAHIPKDISSLEFLTKNINSKFALLNKLKLENDPNKPAVNESDKNSIKIDADDTLNNMNENNKISNEYEVNMENFYNIGFDGTVDYKIIGTIKVPFYDNWEIFDDKNFAIIGYFVLSDNDILILNNKNQFVGKINIEENLFTIYLPNNQIYSQYYIYNCILYEKNDGHLLGGFVQMDMTHLYLSFKNNSISYLLNGIKKNNVLEENLSHNILNTMDSLGNFFDFGECSHENQ